MPISETIELGRYNTLRVIRIRDAGAFIGNEHEEVLLPNKFVPEGAAAGDEIDVFVYTDSEDRLVATTQTPLATEGEFALLKVVDATKHGAFVHWGLDKDLFVPFKEQHRRLEVGKRYVFAITVHQATRRLIGSTRLARFLDYDIQDLTEGDEVSLMVYDFNSVGAMVLVDGAFPGLVFKNELYQTLQVGDELTGYIKALRPDNKLDISLQKRKKLAILDDRGKILKALQDAGGFLPLHDKSDPDAIKATLQMSKKAFKRAIGGLYKSRVISLKPDGIKLNET